MPTRSGPFAFGRVPLTLLFQREVALRIVAPPGTEVAFCFARFFLFRALIPIPDLRSIRVGCRR